MVQKVVLLCRSSNLIIMKMVPITANIEKSLEYEILSLDHYTQITFKLVGYKNKVVYYKEVSSRTIPRWRANT